MSDETMTRIARTLDELLCWTRVQGFKNVKSVLTDSISDDAQRRIYQASVGESSRKVATSTGVSQTTVLRHWRRWQRVGLMNQDPGNSDALRRSFDLADFDLLPLGEKTRAAEGAASAAGGEPTG